MHSLLGKLNIPSSIRRETCDPSYVSVSVTVGTNSVLCRRCVVQRVCDLSTGGKRLVSVLHWTLCVLQSDAGKSSEEFKLCS